MENSANFPTRESNDAQANLFGEVEPCGLENATEKEKRKIAPKEKRTVFTPPTVEEVAAYVAEKGYHVNAAVFWDWNQSKGWMIGKNKMKDWRAAVRTWEQRHKDENTNSQNTNRNGSSYQNRHASVEPRRDVRPEEF